MDPDQLNVVDENTPPPDKGPNAGLGRTPPGGSRSSSHSSSSQRLHPSTCIVLCTFLADGFATFCYIYIAENKCHHQEDAITTYFNSVGQEVAVLPCLDFNIFMADYTLLDCNMTFVNNLPQHIILEGICILQANQYNASPNHDWLPSPPDLSSFNASSRLANTAC